MATHFTRSDLETLNRANLHLDEALQLIDRAKRCEINCDVAEAIVAEMRRKIEAYKREFFSNPSELP